MKHYESNFHRWARTSSHNGVINEAEKIVKDMTDVFKKYWYPGSRQIPVHEFMPKPDFTYVAPDLEIITDDELDEAESNYDLIGKDVRSMFDEQMEQKFQEILRQLHVGIPHEQILQQLLKDEAVITYAKKALKLHLSKNKGEGSWNKKTQPIHYLLLW